MAKYDNGPWFTAANTYRELHVKMNDVVNLGIQISAPGLEGLIEDVRRTREMLTTNLDNLAVAAARLMQDYILDKAALLSLPDYHTAKGVYPASNTLRYGWNLVLSELANPVTKLGGGAAAFGRRSALDRIRLQELRSLNVIRQWDPRDEGQNVDIPALRGDLGTTEYDRVWMIVEFGTGRYAYPLTKRLEGPTKDKGGSWWLFPGHARFNRYGDEKYLRTPLIHGQRPTHFLLGRRNDSVRFREEANRIRDVIQNILTRMLAGEKFNFSV